MGWLKGDKERPNVLGKAENLCWVCRKAIAGCPWSKNFIPVAGWDAEPDGETYKIRDCPLFNRMKATKNVACI